MQTYNIRSIAAFLVHVLTASCVLLAFWAMMLIFNGRYGAALQVLGLAGIIDAIDGTLARRLDVKQRIPWIDGALLDNIADYLTWVFVPLFWAYVAVGVPAVVAGFCLMASVFGFSHVKAKTDDNFFRGFPSYWNFLMLYFFVFDAGSGLATAILLVCGVLVLAPIKLLYPSRTSVFFRLTLMMSVPYTVLLVIMLWLLQDTPQWLSVISLYYPVYYVVASAVAVARK